jgi:anthranilate phosphoribosyltransferase
MSDSLRPLLHRISGALTGGRIHNLSAQGAHDLFTALLEGEGSDAQLAMFLAAMRVKGSCAEELVGAAQAARARIDFPTLPTDTIIVATSRRGRRVGPPLGLASAVAAAAAGVPVLLQSAPALQEGGVTLGDLWTRMVGPLLGDPAPVGRQLEHHRLACWQPTLADSGWERLQRIEDETLLRGIPDVVTKLLAPEGAPMLAAALPGPVLGIAGDAFESLGHEQVLVVQGVEGSLDPSVVEMTRGLRIVNGMKTPMRLRPADFALFEDREPTYTEGEALDQAVDATWRALLGAHGPEACTAALGGALMVSLVDRDRDLATCLSRVVEAIESGAASSLLRRLCDGQD